MVSPTQLTLCAAFAISSVASSVDTTPAANFPDDRLADLAGLVKPKGWLRHDELRIFVLDLPEERRIELLSHCGLTPSTSVNSSRREFEDSLNFVGEIRRRTTRWISRPSIVEPLDYHSELERIATSVNVAINANMTTLDLERAILHKCFTDYWDTLSLEQRNAFAHKFALAHPEFRVDPVPLASMSGATVLGSGIAASSFFGFAFYCWMSSTIATAGSVIGVTFPFSLYAANSTFWGIATGPVGWGTGLTLAGVAAYRLSAPQPASAVPLVAAIHALRIESLSASQARANARTANEVTPSATYATPLVIGVLFSGLSLVANRRRRSPAIKGGHDAE